MTISDRTQIGFNDSAAYVLRKLEKCKIALLATCGKDMRVSARSMSIVNDGLVLWFQSDSRFAKSKQIGENPNVAFCFENVQFEGLARNMGHSSLEGNFWFCREFEKYHKSSFDAYTMTKNEEIYRVEPLRITLWRYEDNRTFRDFLDIANESAWREYYSVVPQ